MRLILLAVGRVKAGPERELLARYLARAQAGARALGIPDVIEIEVDESRAKQAERRKIKECQAILGKIPQGSRVVLLHERGRASGSVALATAVANARDRGETAFCFVIGGPDGFAPTLLAQYDTLGFGAVTFPHQLVRVLVAEQIYRITTILAGHPYHRA